MQPTRQSRIQILKPDEIDELYRRPEFSQAQREEYFSLDDQTLEHIRTMVKLETRIYFILFIGYFRSKPVIPKFHLKDVRQDVRYICQTYFSGAKPQYTALAKATRSRLINQVIALLGFEPLTPVITDSLTARLQDVATIYTDPRYMFDECLAFFGQQRIALPAYTSVQTLVTQALSAERQRTEQILSREMSEVTVRKLQGIMANKGLLNSLSGYKGSARGFSPSELDRELDTHQTIKSIYPELKSLLDSLRLSRGNMLYYASIVKHRSVYKLRRAPKWQGLLYLVCYLFFRYRENNDKLVTAFCYLVTKHSEAAKAFAQQKVAEELEVIRDKLKYAGSVLSFFIDDTLDDTVPFGEIRKQAFTLIGEDDMKMISQHLNKKDFDLVDYQWQYTDKHARKTANSLRKLFISIDIECDPDQSLLAGQIGTSKDELAQKRRLKTIAHEFIRPRDQAYLVDGDEINPRRFEFYLYYRVVSMLDSGRVYVSESEQNKRLEDDLISSDTWNKDRLILIEKTGLERLHTPITHILAELETKFNTLLDRVTTNINADANDFVKCQPRSNRLTWSLANRRWKASVDNPVYSQLKHMGIIEIMSYVNQKTGYLGAFDSIASRKKNTDAREEDLIACIFGNGANYGLHRIASVSDRSVGALRAVNDSYIRPETTHTANDLISNAIAKLPIFKHYTINEAAPFGSIDGQKHACRINTFKARFSAKYFRKGKGVSAMTLVVNHVPVNTAVNAPNEYEGHFAFDLLYNNSSEIQPSSVATDNHGINNVNFALLDIFGYQFAPRYARFKHTFEDLFEITLGEDLHISLKKPIKHKLIVEEWEHIQHIICSLSRKATNQSTVVKKLSNSKRNGRTLAALREYDRLIKCLYVLEYVDSQTLRQFVQQALNRGEAYHQLRRAIASVNGNQFRGGNDYQVEQWNDCARLIANCIIYYNSALLSGLVERFEKQGNQDAVEMLANLSPVAWSHIQLAGNYTFAEQQETFSLDSMLENVDPLAESTIEDDEDVD
ncbi:Tn3 family transposase [Aeromonas salmonicida]|uniref:Tn3 family transposase n=1 Tax=Aeromonas salmonicida TaxID=645 RepID=UPI001788D3BA|nr:Tn3 family transposase [Aeromonas salmonicida]QOI95944.1 Tn3 family transposase [Aeromonas salmonicida subsp. masoucida]